MDVADVLIEMLTPPRSGILLAEVTRTRDGEYERWEVAVDRESGWWRSSPDGVPGLDSWDPATQLTTWAGSDERSIGGGSLWYLHATWPVRMLIPRLFYIWGRRSPKDPFALTHASELADGLLKLTFTTRDPLAPTATATAVFDPRLQMFTSFDINGSQWRAQRLWRSRVVASRF